MNDLPNAEQLNVELAQVNKEIELKPSDPSLYMFRAGIYSLLAEYIEEQKTALKENAIADYDKVIELDKDISDAYSCRAMILLELHGVERVEQILSDCKRAQALDAESAYPHMVQTILYWMQERYEDAIQSGTATIELDEENYFAYLHRGRSYAALKEWIKAGEDLNAAIHLVPNDSKAYYDRSKVFAELGMFGRSLRDAQQAALLDPKSPVYNRPDLLDLINS